MTASVACFRQLAHRFGSRRSLGFCATSRYTTRQTCRQLHDASLMRWPAEPLAHKAPTAQTTVATSQRRFSADQFNEGSSTANDGQKLSKKRHPRAHLRSALKQYSKEYPPPSALVRPAQNIPSKAENRRSHRKHVNSIRTQSLHGIKSLVSGKPDHEWRETLALLAQHTPDSREVLNFRVTIGKGAATEARARLLSGLDSNVWQISRRYQSVIHVEEGDNDGSLALNLSGSETAVRLSLLEVLRVVGQVTALRVHNSELRAALAKDWERRDATTARVKLLDIGDVATEDVTLTLRDEMQATEAEPFKGQADSSSTLLDDIFTTSTTKHKYYMLERPASKIEPPALWTKRSFEEYVAALTYGEVPPQRASEFYGSGPSHQEVVASLLVRAFTSADTKPAISLSAVKLALVYLQKRGPGLRPANEKIFAQIELQDLPADAETYSILLVGASKVGDLRSYTSVLKTMIRKGFRPQARAWLAFLEMTQDRAHKRRILTAMQRKGLDRNRSIYNEMARHQVLIELESQIAKRTKPTHTEEAESYHIGAFIQEQDRRHGLAWLNTVTLNKMLDVLGSTLELEACKHLLAIAQKEERAAPDVVTLNTMLTHTRGIPEWISMMETMLSRYSWLRPDKITFHTLFSIAWSLNRPNMMAVIWKYATIAQLAPSKMRSRLNKILVREHSDPGSAGLEHRRIWSPILFGSKELEDATSAANSVGKPVSFYDVAANYQEATRNKTPAANFAQKLREAYENDIALYKLRKEKGEVTTQEMKELSVEILMEAAPLVRKV
ncbi:uncharacterized protein B0I36DRAFT_330579 [Microdochium trichocladiopsis]|uniref:Pentatricopeptide repeat domain-containing protein n=1 Tax=Microdochium trichocladiopsis TaxID=1682393 RepID=A0A9P9BQZ6_9PEZI|nr:uncharacterized protein B0I36DRAFT_330579 [Microdochium trichocladiopsis]KAH7026397.1 hypothetical protein B0I36DRAFT_330579 [Microdochium trichocladiopsis]